MNTKLARYIVSLLTCLFFCSQAYAQVPDLDDPSLNPSHGTNMEDPLKLKFKEIIFHTLRMIVIMREVHPNCIFIIE